MEYQRHAVSPALYDDEKKRVPSALTIEKSLSFNSDELITSECSVKLLRPNILRLMLVDNSYMVFSHSNNSRKIYKIDRVDQHFTFNDEEVEVIDFKVILMRKLIDKAPEYLPICDLLHFGKESGRPKSEVIEFCKFLWWKNLLIP